MRTFLAKCYDRIVDEGHRLKEILRTDASFLTRLFWRSRLRIGGLPPQDQLAALQRAFARRDFFERAFADFNQKHPPEVDGLPDWDAFVATCLLACGDARHRWHADRWLRGDRLPPDVLQPYHLDHPCQGAEKIRNSLFTLNRLVNRTFCLAFDQLEDTYRALAEWPSGVRSAQIPLRLACCGT